MFQISQSSIGRKYSMALSAFFLLIFLLQHFVINSLSVFNPEAFNQTSHFMGNNAFIQFVMQPILTIAVVYHFIMGIILELQNKKAKPQKYAVNNAQANSTWISRNMIWTGLTIAAFLVLHFIDFWFPEMQYKYICKNPEDPTRYYFDLVQNFKNPIKVALYILAFVFLALHLGHGFKSAFQSVGINAKKYNPIIVTLGKLYAIIIPFGFICIALYHFLTHK